MVFVFVLLFFCIFVVCSLLFEGVSESTEFCRLLGSVIWQIHLRKDGKWFGEMS